MGKIKKILENELVGGTQTTDVYPVTSTKAVYDENNQSVDNILKKQNNKIVGVNYVTCDTAAGTSTKVLTIEGLTDISTGIRLLVKMTNNNTASNANLNINGLGAKPLYYNNKAVSDDNSWESGEVIDVYFDGTNFQSSNVQGGSGNGGNMILEWNTDVPTTRKQVKAKARKALLQISYVDANNNNINEQYIGTSFTDTDWAKDENWERIITFDVDANENYPTPLSNGVVYAGYGFFSVNSTNLKPNSALDVIAYPINKGEIYTIDDMCIATPHITSMALAIKEGNAGTGADFRLLLPTELYSKAPYLGLGNFSINSTTGVITITKKKNIINPIYLVSGSSEQLYLIITHRFNTVYNQARVYTGEISDASYKNVFVPKNGTIDNYEYIKEKSCELGNETTKNLFSKDNISFSYGVIYNTEGKLTCNNTYQCTYIPLEFDTYYTVSGYKWAALGGTTGANNVCLACIKNETIVNLKVSDFKGESTWLNTDTFFTKADNIYKERIRVEVFTFKTPKATDLNVDSIGLVINTLFEGKPTEFVNELQVEVGISPTDYVEGGGTVLKKVFGYSLPQTSSAGGSGTSGNAIVNYLKNQVMFFFGDSITQGTDGGYVDLVKEKVGLGNALNYGSSGAATPRLVDIMTGLGIREPASAKTVDYMMCKAITIQIGTNGGVSGDINKDIPNVSICDINSYPYSYSNPEGTITEATIENDEDYFKKVFPNTFYGNLALCLEWVRWKNPNCRIYLITIPPSDRNNHIKVREALIELGRLYAVHVIDAQANAGLSIRNIVEWSKDKTHLNYFGNELWASYIAQELITNYYNTNDVE